MSISGYTLTRLRTLPLGDYFVDYIELLYAHLKQLGRTKFNNIIEIDPQNITHKKKPYFHFLRDINLILESDWDEQLDLFEDSITYRGIREHIIDHMPWEETSYFTYCLQEINNGHYLFGCTNKQDLLRRCNEIDLLHKSIIEHGVVYPGPDSRLSTYDSITVNIARDGTFIFNNGNHRLTIAKLLGISRVPVRILVRHSMWVKRAGKYPTHPDFIANRDLYQKTS